MKLTRKEKQKRMEEFFNSMIVEEEEFLSDEEMKEIHRKYVEELDRLGIKHDYKTNK